MRLQILPFGKHCSASTLQGLSSKWRDYSLHPSQNRTYRFPVSGSSTRTELMYIQNEVNMVLVHRILPTTSKTLPMVYNFFDSYGWGAYATLSEHVYMQTHLGNYQLLRSNYNALLILHLYILPATHFLMPICSTPFSDTVHWHIQFLAFSKTTYFVFTIPANTIWANNVSLNKNYLIFKVLQMLIMPSK